MTTRLARIDRLLTLCRETITALEASQAPDLDAFGDAFDDAMHALSALPAIAPDDPDLAVWRQRLRELERLQTRLQEVLGVVRYGTQSRLLDLGRGRRGLEGYRGSLADGRRGTHRGRG